jgi:pimeloyl-ACP methyl ester carboxylesterase
MQVIVKGLLTNYSQTGRGPVLLFVHGWGDSLSTFNSVIKQFEKNYLCISLDLPGFGKTQIPNVAWGVKDYSEFIESFVKKLDLDLYAVIGHSNGGTILMYCASHDLIGSEKLVLIASAGIRDEDAFKKSLYKVLAKSGKLVTRFLSKKAQAKFRKKLYSTAGSDILISPDLEETFKKVVGYDIQNDAKNIKAKTLLIYAEDDEATPVRYGEKLSVVIDNSELKILSSGGHFIHQTETEKTAEIIKEFLK